MTADQEKKIVSIATYFAMELDLSPKIVLDYCMLICTSDLKSIYSLKIWSSPEAYAILCDIEKHVTSGFWAERDAIMTDVRAKLIDRLREAKCLR